MPLLILGVNYFPLRNVTLLDRFERTDSYAEDWQNTCLWLSGLYDGYWKWPSEPRVISSRPNYEVRRVEIPNTNDVVVWYQYHHVEHWTDLLLVWQIPA